MASVQRASTFGMLLKQHREAACLTQEALAECAGISARGISDLERGVIRAPRPTTLRLLARALALDAAAEQQLETVARGLNGPAAPASSSVRRAVPVLVGRERELELLDRHLAGHEPPLLLLAGQPGIGKSRLLQEAGRRAIAQGWRVLAGGCTSAGGQQPFAPLLQALHAHLTGGSAAERRADLRGCAWLVRLLPELAADEIEPLPGWTLSPEQERRLVFGAVGRLLSNVAGPAGTLLLLDDLQWAGADTLDLVTSLLHPVPGAPLRLVGAFRDTDVAPEHPLTFTLAVLAEAQLALCRSVPPLADHDAEALIAHIFDGSDRVDAGLIAQVVQRVGGVPFFLVSYARSLQEEGGDAIARSGVPWDLRQSLQRRLLALPETGRALVAAAAIVGRVTPRTLLLRLLERPEAELLDALERACHAGLLEEVGEDAYGFVHDVIREVAESDLGQARRAALHRRVAETLEQQVGARSVELLAYHYARSGLNEQALRYLELAGDRACGHAAHSAAEGFYRDVLARLDAAERTLDGARVREKLGVVLMTALRTTEALELLEQAAEVLHACQDEDGLGRVMARIGSIHYVRGTTTDCEIGITRLQPVLTLLEAQGPSRSLASVYCTLGSLHSALGQAQAALAAADRAADLARSVGAHDLLAEAELWRGSAMTQLGRAEESLAVIERSSRLAAAAGNPTIQCSALCRTALHYEDRGEFDRARQAAQHALTLAERLADSALIIQSIGRLGALAFFEGRWQDALRQFESIVSIPDHDRHFDCLCPLELGRLRMGMGEWEQAAHDLEICSGLARLHGAQTLVRVSESYLAERDLLEGRPEMARARLVPLRDRTGMQEMQVTTYLLPVLAWAHLELGETDQAEQAIAEALLRARQGRFRLTLVGAFRVQALIALHQGDTQAAADALDEGLSLARAIPYPHREGWLLEVYGRLHQMRGEPAAARARLEEAAAIFRRLGAQKDLERVQQALATLDRQPATKARRTGHRDGARAVRHAKPPPFAPQTGNRQ